MRVLFRSYHDWFPAVARQSPEALVVDDHLFRPRQPVFRVNPRVGQANHFLKIERKCRAGGHERSEMNVAVSPRDKIGDYAGEVGALQPVPIDPFAQYIRSEEHTSELQSLMRISYAVFCLKKKTTT